MKTDPDKIEELLNEALNLLKVEWILPIVLKLAALTCLSGGQAQPHKTHVFIAQWSLDALVRPLERLALTLAQKKRILFLPRLQIDRAYHVQTSANLLKWHDDYNFTATAGTNSTISAEFPTSAAFFRLRW